MTPEMALQGIIHYHSLNLRAVVFMSVLCMTAHIRYLLDLLPSFQGGEGAPENSFLAIVSAFFYFEDNVVHQ
jgi:hypothetical protein